MKNNWLLSLGGIGVLTIGYLLVVDPSEQREQSAAVRHLDSLSAKASPSSRQPSADLALKGRPEEMMLTSLRTDQQFEQAIFDGAKLDDFIALHTPRAHAGDADSAYYLAEAMKYCSMELAQFDLSFAYYDTQGNEASKNLERQAQTIMDGLIGKPEFYQRQVRRHLDRAIACKSLGVESQDLYQQASKWDQKATELLQPIALARAAKLNPSQPNIPAERLNHSKSVMREALSRSRDMMTLLHASSVVAVATGRDYTTERLAWGILACEYTTCDKLNYLYLGKCEAMVLNGNANCSEEMSDLDYLRLKYPDTFDVARGRASELYEALEKEDWSTVGLN